MILNAKIKVFYGFCGDFWLQDTFPEQIAQKSTETDMEKLHTKFSALNIDFNGQSLNFLDSRKPAYEGIKQR